MEKQIPVTPLNGRVMVRPLPYKPSKILEFFTHDKAFENEGIVEAVSECQYAYRLKRDSKGRTVGREMTGITFPHEVKVGDRVMFPGKYVDDDTHTLNGVKYRYIESWEILCRVEADQPEGFDNPITGEKTPDDLHQMLTEKLSTQTVDTSVKSQILTP